MLDRRFFDVNLVVQGIANSPAENPSIGTQYIVGESPAGAFNGAKANQLARWNGSKWIFITPKNGGLEVFNVETKEILNFNGTAWVSKTTFSGEGGSGGGYETVTEKHVLTAEEATNKSFTLSNAIMSGKESDVILSVCGVMQIAGEDFTASGNTISWDNKTLADIGIQVDDIFLVQYIKA